MADSNLISFEKYKEKKQQDENEKAVWGTMVWLFCPTCQTLEYSEIVAPNGRTHKCGTLVQEAEVNLDLKAELTITAFNLAKIEELINKNSEFKLVKLVSKSLDKALASLRISEKLYQERLQSAAGQKIHPYHNDLESIKHKLPIVERNKLGLYISEFRHEPEKRFKQNRK